MIKDDISMLNFLYEWGQAYHLTPTFIIENERLYCVMQNRGFAAV